MYKISFKMLLGVVILITMACSSNPNSDGTDTSEITGEGEGEGQGEGEGEGEGEGGSTDTFDECAGLTEEAEAKHVSSDIVFVVDNSASMKAEAQMVQDGMNSFAQQVVALGVEDAHVVLISEDSEHDRGICVGPDLGSGNCPDDSNPAKNYLHVARSVSSSTSLSRICDTYDDNEHHWKEMIRDDSVVHFVIVSDDNSSMSKDEFIECLSELSPPIDDYVVHAIVATEDDIDGGVCEDLAAEEGTVYKELVAETGGVLGNLCEQEFQPVFEQLAGEVSVVTMSCQWDLPEPPEGETFDKNKVNVEFTDNNGVDQTIGHVDSLADCQNVEHGWYYDDSANPVQILVCPQTCDWIQGQSNAKLTIAFGCDTQDATPV